MTFKIDIPQDQFEFVFSRSSGPGGQNVNKVNSQVTAILDIKSCSCLTSEKKGMIFHRLGNRIDKQGRLQVTSSRTRSQHDNRQDAVDRICHLIEEATRKIKPRRPTKISHAAKIKRQNQKKHHSMMKKRRSNKIALE